jgi:hypothetical protein
MITILSHSVAPHEVDLAELRHQCLVAGIRLQRAVDQISGLVIETVGHVEVRFGKRIGLVEVDRRFAAERILERIELARRTRALGYFRHGRFERLVLHRADARVLLHDDEGFVGSRRLQRFGRRQCTGRDLVAVERLPWLVFIVTGTTARHRQAARRRQ